MARRYRRRGRGGGRGRGLGSVRGILSTVMAGFGAAAIGSMVASKINVPGGATLAGGAIGYLGGGLIPALIGAFGPQLIHQPTQQATQTGNVWT